MKMIYNLEGLDCAHCAAKIERAVSKIKGVNCVTVSFMTTKMTIDAQDEKAAEVEEKAVSIVNKYEPDVVVKRRQ